MGDNAQKTRPIKNASAREMSLLKPCLTHFLEPRRFARRHPIETLDPENGESRLRPTDNQRRSVDETMEAGA
jgi:hypothetical protein